MQIETRRFGRGPGAEEEREKIRELATKEREREYKVAMMLCLRYTWRE